VGLLGFGSIGHAVADIVRAGKAGTTAIVSVLVRDLSKHAARVGDQNDFRFTTDAAEFLRADVELVVEAAGHEALRRYAEPVLNAHKHLVAVSVGAFADHDFLNRVRRVAEEQGRQVLVPSGAIAGLDAIGAAALAELDLAVHTSRKPPRAFTAEQLSGAHPKDPMLLYDGPARDGVLRFPENVNVAAAVSLAGLGLDRTRLRVFADPTVQRNSHEVEVHGWFGRLRVIMENTPSENPKTGRIVALSVAKVLRNLSAPVVIGA